MYMIMGLLYILLMVREVAHGPEDESEKPELAEDEPLEKERSKRWRLSGLWRWRS